MKLLKAIRDVKYPNGILNKGEIVFVTEENRIVQGHFMNKILQGYDCEFVDPIALNQANLMHVENEKVLMQDNERLQRQFKSIDEYAKKKAEQNRILRHDSDLLYGDYKKLQTDNGLLAATLERAMLDRQPVVLPKKQVDAINFFKNPPKGIYTNWGNDTIIDCVLHHGTYADDYELPLTALREISFDTLLSALVNGHTVEQSPEEANEAAFRAGMEAIYKEMDNEKFNSFEEKRVELAGRLIPLIKEIYQH